MMGQWDATDILRWARKRIKPFKSPELVRDFGMSRQTAARQLKALVERGALIRTGSTQKATYHIPKKGEKPARPLQLTLHKRLKGLAEDRVFAEVDLRMDLKTRLSENTYRIAYYAFTEMLNNAIDHSAAATTSIEMNVEKGVFSFRIRDRGIGVFKNIKKTFHLPSDEDAVEHLLKGKQTTAPAAHSGQGIFFTSKIGDRFALDSYRLRLVFNNQKNDISLGGRRPLKGTEVYFAIKCQGRKSLSGLFQQYANKDFEFDRTKYPVIILHRGGGISRSQARRLTAGLENFDRVIFDFAKVSELGQGFADEIFRIFQRRNPKTVLEIHNANPAVNFMIQRAIRAGSPPSA